MLCSAVSTTGSWQDRMRSRMKPTSTIPKTTLRDTDNTGHEDTLPPAREFSRSAALMAGGSFFAALAILMLAEWLRH